MVVRQAVVDVCTFQQTTFMAMGMAKNAVPKFFWKYVKGAENAQDGRKVLWGSVEAL